MQLSPYQQKKLERLARIADGGEIALAEEINALDDKIDSVDSKLAETSAVLDSKINDALKIAEDTSKQIGPKGDKGDSYSLTQQDKKEIARSIPVPIVEKVIERTEVIREVPLVNEARIAESASKQALEAIKPFIPVIPPSPTASEMVALINDLAIEPELQISEEHIKGLIDLKEKVDGLLSKNKTTYLGGVRYLAGSNITIEGNVISATAGGYQAPTSGTVDGSNQTFVFATAPTLLSVDGVPKQKTQSDGTVNWTGTTTVVLTVAPNYDIFAIS